MQDTKKIRLAAIVYSQTEGIQKKINIQKRIIEAVFVTLNNACMDEMELQLKTNDIFDIYLSTDEIINIIEGKKTREFYEKSAGKEGVKYCLSAKRFDYLKGIEEKNIEYYITLFIEEKEYSLDIRDTIYKYLYSLFKHNLEDFSNLLGGKVKQEELDNNFSTEELEKIQEFLSWDNPDKDKEIQTLMGSSLEYAMLTSDNSAVYGTRLGNVFSNKVLYIDTNIIFYCLGINGEKYRIANESLLEKCLEAKEEIRVTKYTEQEFENTLNHYIDDIKKYESPTMYNIPFNKYINNQDIYLYYLEWKAQRSRFNTLDYFKSFLLSEYYGWKKKYKVKTVKKEPFDLQENLEKQTLEQFVSEIPYKGTMNYDAYNVMWAETERQREQGNNSFSMEKYFVLSSHKLLKKWDNGRNGNVPLIVMPEVWMTLLCKFISRSAEDYKSYINFINIKTIEEDKIGNREFLIILNAIEQITDDIKQQEYIIDALVEQEYSYLNSIAEAEITDNDIIEKTKEEAEKILRDKVTILEEAVCTLDDKVSDLESKKILLETNETQKISDAIEKERNINAEVYVKNRLIRKRIVNICIIIAITASIVWQLYDFFIQKNPQNLLWMVVSYLVANTPIANKVDDVFIIVLQMGLTIGIGYIDLLLLKIFYDSEKIENYKKRMADKYVKILKRYQKNAD